MLRFLKLFYEKLEIIKHAVYIGYCLDNKDTSYKLIFCLIYLNVKISKCIENALEEHSVKNNESNNVKDAWLFLCNRYKNGKATLNNF